MMTFLKSLIVALGILAFTATANAGTIVIKKAPPKVKVEVRPTAPYKNAVWIPGHWEWKRGRYVWIKGHWEKQRKGYVWVSGRHLKRNGSWVWVRGHWKRS